MRYGLALRAAADEEDAVLELRAARSAFERLGAAEDAARAAAALGELQDRPRRMTGREVEVLRLVAAGKTNREIAAELVISEHTVARHVQNIYAKLEVSSRSARHGVRVRARPRLSRSARHGAFSPRRPARRFGWFGR